MSQKPFLKISIH